MASAAPRFTNWTDREVPTPANFGLAASISTLATHQMLNGGCNTRMSVPSISSHNGSPSKTLKKHHSSASSSSTLFDYSSFSQFMHEDGQLIRNRVFVGGFGTLATEDELCVVFSQFGAVKDVKVIFDKAGASKGYGFVTFMAEDDAKTVLKNEELKRHVFFKNRKLNIGPAVKRPPEAIRESDNSVCQSSSATVSTPVIDVLSNAGMSSASAGAVAPQLVYYATHPGGPLTPMYWPGFSPAQQYGAAMPMMLAPGVGSGFMQYPSFGYPNIPMFCYGYGAPAVTGRKSSGNSKDDGDQVVEQQQRNYLADVSSGNFYGAQFAVRSTTPQQQQQCLDVPRNVLNDLGNMSKITEVSSGNNAYLNHLAASFSGLSMGSSNNSCPNENFNSLHVSTSDERTFQTISPPVSGADFSPASCSSSTLLINGLTAAIANQEANNAQHFVYPPFPYWSQPSPQYQNLYLSPPASTPVTPPAIGGIAADNA